MRSPFRLRIIHDRRQMQAKATSMSGRLTTGFFMSKAIHYFHLAGFAWINPLTMNRSATVLKASRSMC